MTLAIRDSLPSLHWVCVATGYDHPQISANKISEKLINLIVSSLFFYLYCFFNAVMSTFRLAYPALKALGQAQLKAANFDRGMKCNLVSKL
jgi:hypothetical protein